jgi:hypothetical protein
MATTQKRDYRPYHLIERDVMNEIDKLSRLLEIHRMALLGESNKRKRLSRVETRSAKKRRETEDDEYHRLRDLVLDPYPHSPQYEPAVEVPPLSSYQPGDEYHRVRNLVLDPPQYCGNCSPHYAPSSPQYLSD